VPALSDGWKGSFRELLAKAEGGAPAAPAWTGFRPVSVAEVRRESATITSFRLVPADGPPSSQGVQAGQYLTVRVQPDANAPPLTRSYSLSDLPDERGYRISVRREGEASRYLHQHVKVGDLLDAAARTR
jgi:ferredoxin-NADP reductase